MRWWETGFAVKEDDVWPVIYLYEGPWWSMALLKTLDASWPWKNKDWWIYKIWLPLSDWLKNCVVRETTNAVPRVGNEHLMSNVALRLAKRKQKGDNSTNPIG